MNQPNKEEFVKKKVVAGICGILIGSLGVHKFVVGLTTPGIIMLVATVLTCGFAAAIFGVVGLIEGVIYLTKDDDQFYQDLFEVEMSTYWIDLFAAEMSTYWIC